MKNQKLEIVLQDFSLSSSQIANLEKDVHAVVAKHLMNANLNNSLGTKIIKNPEWLGIWLKKFQHDKLINKSKTFKPANLNQLGR
jgi:hypothetical protein